MAQPREVLFGGWPRCVGATDDGMIDQFFVHSKEEFEYFYSNVRSEKNTYSSICHFSSINGHPQSWISILDKVVFDFDSPMKEAAFPDDMPDGEKIEMMLCQPDMADEVLGDVVTEAQAVIEQSMNEDIPVYAVFSGMGIHVHQLYQEEKDPERKIATTARRYLDQLDLQTADLQIIGDTRRLLRVPNAQRIDEKGPTGFWTIPLKPEEVIESDASDLLEMATMPRNIEFEEPEERPEMQIYADYTRDSGEALETRELDDTHSRLDGEEVDWLLNRQIKLPCMVERVKQRNPDHRIRLNFAVMLFNLGYSPDEVCEIIKRLRWKDFNEEMTMKYLRQIYSKKYSDHSCDTLMSKGYCVYPDDPDQCPTKGWKGGNLQY